MNIVFFNIIKRCCFLIFLFLFICIIGNNIQQMKQKKQYQKQKVQSRRLRVAITYTFDDYLNDINKNFYRNMSFHKYFDKKA